MHNQKDTLKILNCSKMTLSRYVDDGSLERIKKGRNTYYDEHEVAALVLKIENNKKKVGIEIKPKEKITIPEDTKPDFEDEQIFQKLTPMGMEILATATLDLQEMGLYKDCDKQILLMYAFSGEMVSRFGCKMLDHDGISTNESGTQTVHPYHKMMQYHEKQMLNYSDRLGLNPLSRTKFEIKTEKESKSIMEALTEKEDW